MTSPAPDGSRDPRIEDPTNRWIVHPLSRALLRPALRLGVTANAVSVAGLFVGAVAALSFHQWREPGMAMAGLLLATGWLVLDGLDGMVARATGTASPLGRLLDGLCDHGVFVLIYAAVAASIGGAGTWALAVAAGCLHAIQSNLYEGERARYHRRIKGLPTASSTGSQGGGLVRAYDALAFALDRAAARFDALFAGPDARRIALVYGEQAAGPMRLQALLTGNMRVLLLFLACLAGDPKLFWWFEIGPLSLVAAAGIAWHRVVEARLTRCATPFPPVPGAAFSKDRSN